MSVPFALSSAVVYGFGDFAGGLAARRTPVLRVTAVAQVAGLVALLPAAFLVPGHVSAAAVGYGALAGVGGMSGLLLYMRGLAVGPMGVVAPLSAVVGAGLPLVAGVLGGERPGAAGWLALVVALVAIALASAGSRADAAAGVISSARTIRDRAKADIIVLLDSKPSRSNRSSCPTRTVAAIPWVFLPAETLCPSSPT